MKKIILVISVLILSFSLYAEINFSGSVQTEAAAAMPWTKNCGKFIVAETDVSGKLNYFTDKTSVLVDGSASYNPVKLDLTECKPVYDYGFNSMSAKLKEAYFDYNGGWWSLRVGRQISTWGAADKFVVTNVLCPVDETMVTSVNVSDKMLGIDAVKLSFNNDFLLFDCYWIPFFTPSKLPVELDAARPELTIWNGEAAARLSAYFSFADFSLYGFYGFEDKPLMKIDLNTGNFHGTYERLLMFGCDSSIPVGPVTIRAEAAFYPERSFSNYMKIEKHNNLLGLAGFDLMPGDWTITGQYFADYVFGDVSSLDRKNFDHKASLGVSYSITSINLDLSLSGMIDFVDFDSVIVAGVNYALTDEFKISLEGYFIIPGFENEGEYGKLKDFSCVKISARYTF